MTYLSDAEKVQAVVYVNKQTDKNQWMADTETLLRESIKGSPFTLQRQDNGWLVTAPARQSFNPDRPGLLLPAVLKPITQMAKALESSPDSAVLVLGHSDLARNEKVSYDLSKDRATAVASIFRLSGLNGYRMSQLAMGSSHTLPTKRSAADNDRVEIIVVPTAYKQDVMAVYNPAYQRQLALSQTK
ncbi:MAG: OmpA family protein [Gammaproteobacteria bacterium]|nr:OmpA family protein [Gammaproteobacteria bacterium]